MRPTRPSFQRKPTLLNHIQAYLLRIRSGSFRHLPYHHTMLRLQHLATNGLCAAKQRSVGGPVVCTPVCMPRHARSSLPASGATQHVLPSGVVPKARLDPSSCLSSLRNCYKLGCCVIKLHVLLSEAGIRALFPKLTLFFRLQAVHS